MNIEIQRKNGTVLIVGDYESVKDCLEKNRNIDFRGASLVNADLQGINLRGYNFEGSNFEGADLRGSDLRGANLEGANLKEANLERSDLRGANLINANLKGANLRGADLEGANLEVAEGIILPSIFICGSRHNFYYIDGKIRIGCEKYPVEYWIENYKDIGKDHEYTEDQIEEYYQYIKFCIDIKGEEE